jgi:5'-nucleotidase
MTRIEPIVIDILVDLDGTMVDFIKGWKKLWNQKHPDRPITNDPTVPELEIEYASIAKEEEIMDIMHTPGFFLDLEPLPGAIEAFHQMAACGIELFICSTPTRANTSWSEKADWVEMNLGKEWVKKLILTRDKTVVAGDYLIDDKPIIEGICEPEWEHIIFNASYNQKDVYGNKFRIDWATWPSLLLYHAAKR